MCGQNVQITSNSSGAIIATANPNLDGTGTKGTVLNAGNLGTAGGTTVNSITIKARTSNTLGMVRLFISNGVNSFLYREVMVPANNQTGVVPAFTAVIDEPIFLQPGYILEASTQNAQSFSVFANGQDILNCPCD